MYLVNFRENIFIQDSQVSTILIVKINNDKFLKKYPNAHSINVVVKGAITEVGYYANEEEAHKEMMGFLSAVNSGQGYYVFRDGSILSAVREYFGE